MDALDRKIAEAIRQADAGLGGPPADEPGLLETLVETFRGKRRWLNLLGALWTLAFLALGVASAVAFFRAEATRDLILWATACILCAAAVALLKVWYWMEMQRIGVMREVKRLEWQVARLAAQLRGG